MKLNILKQIIKEEILKEIRVQPPIPLELVEVPGGYELLVGNEYRTNDHSYERLQNYKELPGYVDDELYEDDKFISLINPEPSFGGGASEAEIDDSYNIWTNELMKIQNVFEKYNVKYEYDGGEVFRIPVDQIRNWSKIEIIDEIKAQAPGSYGITVDGEIINLPSDERSLNCFGFNLREIIINDKDLGFFHCGNNKLTKLDLRHCPNLRYIYCNYNQLTNLDLSNCPNLELLHCDENKLTNLDLSNCPKLENLNCEANRLTSLDISNCPNLRYLIYDEGDVQIIDNEPLNEIKVEPPVGVAKSPFFTEDGDFLFFNLDYNRFSPAFESIYMIGTNLSDWYEFDPDIKLESGRDLNYYLDKMPSNYAEQYKLMVNTLKVYKIPLNWEFIPGFIDGDDGDEYSDMIRFTIDGHTIPSEHMRLAGGRNLYEIKVEPPVPAGWKKIKVNSNQNPVEDIQIELYKTPMNVDDNEYYDLVSIIKNPDIDWETDELLKPEYYVEVFVEFGDISNGTPYATLEDARIEAFKQMRKINADKNKPLKEIKVETKRASLVFVPLGRHSQNIDPVTSQLGEPKLVIVNKFMIAGNEIKVPDGYIHVKAGNSDYDNNLSTLSYQIKLDNDEDLKNIKDLLDKYGVKNSIHKRDSNEFTTIFVGKDQISGFDNWKH